MRLYDIASDIARMAFAEWYTIKGNKMIYNEENKYIYASLIESDYNLYKGEFKINSFNHIYCGNITNILFNDIYLYEKRTLSTDIYSGILSYSYVLRVVDVDHVVKDVKEKFHEITRLLSEAKK